MITKALDFTVHLKVKLKVIGETEENTTADIERVDIGLTSDGKLPWLGPDGVPTLEGFMALTNSMVYGLISNIHAAHQYKLMDDHAHIKHIVDTLNGLFVNSQGLHSQANAGVVLKKVEDGR